MTTTSARGAGTGRDRVQRPRRFAPRAQGQRVEQFAQAPLLALLGLMNLSAHTSWVRRHAESGDAL